MNPTDIHDPNYFHKVVDCQWACPAHTNVPEYIRLIAQGRYSDAYILNRESNVFPGILGRPCDRPCEPACRRTRVDGKAVAICRLKRVAADMRDDVTDRLPKAPEKKNGKRVALIGAGPASLTVANDLMPLGYEVTIFEKQSKPGGLSFGVEAAARVAGESSRFRIASSTSRTERSSETIRRASCSWNARSGVPSSARACPIRSDPSFNNRWIAGGSWSNLRVFEIVARLLPTRAATSSWVSAKSSMSC